MSKVIGVNVDGVAEWHIPGVGVSDYDTLCCLDANDPSVGHAGLVQPTKGQKITCEFCKMIWEGVIDLKLKKSDFA